ncbi:ABC transporter substrate-binding protein [Aquabacterium fontiphilum]|uniref:ABC transporter substrate-binding protein n=1 Tax=Aquabacterium fontiphilum TaxID=450365 RepID=UPI001377E42F|nr:ABC transporter substrate-binding protein [Aquabacterium fontiphilum]NBD21701.1 ABC transporter substrate-binding protein [Aquabacterium fontiphilum]
MNLAYPGRSDGHLFSLPPLRLVSRSVVGRLRHAVARIGLAGTHAVASAVVAGLCTAPAAVHAQPLEKLTFLTSWYAQAEHGGFYQALATGLYKQAGLDVTIKMGGPQVNGMQLLAAGAADLIIGYDFQVLSGIERGVPAVTVAASFQKDLQGMLTHADVKSLADVKNKTILVANNNRTSWWPWLKAKYDLSESQARPYTFNLQPFFADTNVVQQAYPSSEPFQAQQRGVPTRFFLFADDGYPPYGTSIVTTQALLKAKPDVVKRFVEASMKGWVSYLKDPAPANALIKKDNPNMTDAQIAFGISQLKALKVLDSGDAATQGVGTMTEARWKATRDYMVKEGLLKADTPWQQAFTLDIVRQMRVMP